MVSAGSIAVAVRVRPPSASEAARLPEPVYDTTIRGDGTLSIPARPISSMSCVREVVQVVDDRILTFDPIETDQARAFVERGFLPPGTRRYKDKRFMFDRVFRDDASQQDVYDATARPLLTNLLDGYNATAFAYGATGCGKTHTISGTESDPGIIYLTMADLFQRIEDRKNDYTIEVVVTFLEIYNEEIRDLLAEPGTPTPRGGLQIREDKSVRVVGLTELRPMSAEEVKQIVLLGNSRRTQSPTHANETSSRSHAVLQVHVTQAPRTAALSEERTMGTLSIIDLAGSERAAATSNMGQRMVEGANINKSLLALGNCINALCESGGALRHIPYRNSKLTRLLKFSLGGNCKTVMIVCVAPTSIHFDDTHNTLVYAERATKIKTRVVTRNVVNVDRHVGQYVEAINRLNLEVAELKAKLAGKLEAETEIARRRKLDAHAEVERVKVSLEDKASEMRQVLVDGARCTSQLSCAQLRLRVVRSRLQQLDKTASTSPETSEALALERNTLEALARLDEQAVHENSVLHHRIQRSNNSKSIFEGVLRAATERRSDRLDDVSAQNIRLEARCLRSEIERVRAEAERDAIRGAMESQTQTAVNLLGTLSRCSITIGTAKESLRTFLDDEDSRTGSQTIHELITGWLDPISVRLDEDLKQIAKGDSTLGDVEARVISPVPVPRPVKPRRSSLSLGLRSPRKSLRGVHNVRRPSEKFRTEKKTVQWVDEAGQGQLTSHSRPPPDDSDWEDEKADTSTRPIRPFPPYRSTAVHTSHINGFGSATAYVPMSMLITKLVEEDEDEDDTALTSLPHQTGPSHPSENNSTRNHDADGGEHHFSKHTLDKQNALSPRRHRQPQASRPSSSTVKPSRRRSLVGPQRSERTRRRSSQIPQLSPRVHDTNTSASAPPPGRSAPHAPRRVPTDGPKSPAKRTKRSSLLSMASKSVFSSRPRRTGGAPTLSPIPGDTSVDSSFKAMKPTWK